MRFAISGTSVGFLLLLAACGKDGSISRPDVMKVQTLENVIQFSTARDSHERVECTTV